MFNFKELITGHFNLSQIDDRPAILLLGRTPAVANEEQLEQPSICEADNQAKDPYSCQLGCCVLSVR